MENLLELESLKEEYQQLFVRFNAASQKLEEEKKLNDELIEINRKVAKSTVETSTAMMTMQAENKRLRNTLKHGIFIEYDKSENNTHYIPIMGDLSGFEIRDDKPSRIMYTFNPKDMHDWTMRVKEIMEKNENITTMVNQTPPQKED